MKYQAALDQWEQGGKEGDRPSKPSFFDGPLVRVMPSETYLTFNPKTGERLLVIPVGRTSYFEYVATRDLDPEKYPEEQRATPLAVCGVVTAKDRNGQKYMIYTVRTPKVETYRGFFHVVGGMLTRPDRDIVNPTAAWLKELEEEAGIKPEEVIVEGSLGLVVDTYFFHPELTHIAKLAVDLEEIFNREGINLRPKRETDKEVELRVIPWERGVVRALIVGEKVSGGDLYLTPWVSDKRPWVPTGLGNLLLAGGVCFGYEWFEQTSEEYREKISLLKTEN